MIASRKGATLLCAAALAAGCAKKPELAAPPEPFPNQPGALSAEELQTATAAARSAFPLTSSGKRAAGHPMSAYAVFAGEPTRPATNVVMRRRVVCNYWANQNAWRCGEALNHYVIDAGGRRHQFSVFSMGVPEATPQLLAELAEYTSSACYAEQLQKLAGGKTVPAITTIEDVGADPNGFTLRSDMMAQPNSYMVRRLEPAQGSCRFRLETVRVGKTGEVFP